MAEAIQEYETILRYHPLYVRAYNNLGITYMRRGQLDAAAQALQKALRIDPNFADAHYNLGLIYLKQGQTARGEATMATYRHLQARP